MAKLRCRSAWRAGLSSAKASGSGFGVVHLNEGCRETDLTVHCARVPQYRFVPVRLTSERRSPFIVV